MWLDIQQNTDEWMEARGGKVTGSAISKVMAHFGKDFGEPAKRLAVEIALTQITGKSETSESYSNDHMERGHDQEPLARGLYEDENFTEVTNGGFFDNGLTGCSPDGLVGDDGMVEIKSVIRYVHFKTVEKGTFDSSYKWQLLFNLKESGREWIDYISFCLDYPEGKQLYQFRIHKKDCKEEFDKMDLRLKEFEVLIENTKNKIINKGSK